MIITQTLSLVPASIASHRPPLKMDDRIRKSPDGTVGDVVPGSLLGPVVGLIFSADGELLFACSGSSLSVYGVRSGSLLSTVPVFTPGVAVHGVDVGRERREFAGW